MEGERRVGRFTCREVLARLASFVDGSLDADELADVRVHVGGCDNCARFGGEYASVVRALRSGERPAGDESEHLADRILRLVDAD